LHERDAEISAYQSGDTVLQADNAALKAYNAVLRAQLQEPPIQHPTPNAGSTEAVGSDEAVENAAVENAADEAQTPAPFDLSSLESSMPSLPRLKEAGKRPSTATVQQEEVSRGENRLRPQAPAFLPAPSSSAAAEAEVLINPDVGELYRLTTRPSSSAMQIAATATATNPTIGAASEHGQEDAEEPGYTVTFPATVDGQAIDQNLIPQTVRDAIVEVLSKMNDNDSKNKGQRLLRDVIQVPHSCLNEQYKLKKSYWHVNEQMMAACKECSVGKKLCVRKETKKGHTFIVLPLVSGDRQGKAMGDADFWIASKDSTEATQENWKVWTR
jgi:hypothetical protein